MNKYRFSLIRKITTEDDVKTVVLLSHDLTPTQATPFDECKVAQVMSVSTPDATLFAHIDLIDAEGHVRSLSAHPVKVTDKGFSASTRCEVPALRGFLRLSANFAKMSTSDNYQASVVMTEVGTMITTRAAILAANRPVNSALKRAQNEVKAYNARGERIAEIQRIYDSVSL